MTLTPHQTLRASIAAAIAHRACCNEEQDLANGKLAGYCVVCGVPWPCETASMFLAPALGIHPEAEAAPDFTHALEEHCLTCGAIEEMKDRAEKAEARIRELEAQVRRPIPGIVQTFEEMKARLRAIDAAREGEPSMPGLPDKASVDDLIIHLNVLKAHDRAGWDAAASLRVELAQAKDDLIAEKAETDLLNSLLSEARQERDDESERANKALDERDGFWHERDEARAAQRSAERGEQIAQAELAHDRAKFNVMLEDAKIQERQRFAPLVEAASEAVEAATEFFEADGSITNERICDATEALEAALSDLEGGA